MKEKEIIKVGTFFSGIGSPEKALQKLVNENLIDGYELQFFSEIDRNAIKSYCAIHNVDETLNLGDIKKIKGTDLKCCDLWIGGFPCQDISCAGNMRGFELKSNTRSSLGWEMIRLLKEVEKKPKYVIFENVASITSKKFKNTLDLFKDDLKKLGYELYESVVNAVDYGIPQTRKRYFLVAILNGKKQFSFPKPLNNNKILKDFLEEKVPEKYYLSSSKYKEYNNKRWFSKKNSDKLIYEIDVEKYKHGGLCGKDHSTNFVQSSRIYSENGFAPTLTRSNLANNFKVVINDNKYMKIRKITPIEAWKLMGFDTLDYDNASKVCKETALYEQAGNSMVVNVIYYLLKELLIK